MAASLESLPVELIVMVFLNLEHWSAVTSLAKTSDKFHDIAHRHTSAIFSTVMPRTIICFDDAQVLFNVQRAMNTTDTTPRVIEDEKSWTAVGRKADTMYANHKIATGICRYFDGRYARPFRLMKGANGPFSIVADDRERFALTPTERARFLHAFYRVWSLALMPPASRQGILNKADLRELFWFQLVVDWMDRRWVHKVLNRRVVHMLRGDWGRTSTMMALTHRGKAMRWLRTFAQRQDIPLPLFGVPLQYMAIFDEWQEEFKRVVPDYV